MNTHNLLTMAPRHVVVALLLVQAPLCLAGEFATLARYLPSDANAVVVVNAEKLYGSPIGQRENWRQRSAEAYESTPLVLPPSALRCVLASNLNIETLRPEWEAAAMTLSIDPAIADVAAQRGGTTDSIANFGAAWLGPSTCVVKFAPRTFAVISPTSRQEAARWVADVPTTDAATLSPYLQQAVGYADSVGTQVILAVDLVGAIREGDIRKAVAQSSVLKAIPEDQATAVLSSLRGIKLGVLVGEGLNAKLQIDFAEDVAVFAPIAKPLILGILGEAGAMLDEFHGWTAKAEGKSLSLEGELTSEGMQRIFSVLAFDAAALERGDVEPQAATAPPAPPSAPAPSPAEQAQEARKRASIRYFRSVGKYVADAQKLSRAKSLDQAVMWIENYARRIEALSTRNVDAELVSYGNYVAQTFRGAVDQASGVVSQRNALEEDEQAQYTYRVGLLPTARTVNVGGYFQRMYAPYGFAEYHPDPNAAEKEQKLQDQAYQAIENARQALSQLAADQESVRQKLNQRYNGGF